MQYELVAVGDTRASLHPEIEAVVKSAESTLKIKRVAGAIIGAVGSAAAIIGLAATPYILPAAYADAAGSIRVISAIIGVLSVGSAMKLCLFSYNLFERSLLHENISAFANMPLAEFIYLQNKECFHTVANLAKLRLITASDQAAINSLHVRYLNAIQPVRSKAITAAKCQQAATLLTSLEAEWENCKSTILTNAGLAV